MTWVKKGGLYTGAWAILWMTEVPIIAGVSLTYLVANLGGPDGVHETKLFTHFLPPNHPIRCPRRHFSSSPPHSTGHCVTIFCFIFSPSAHLLELSMQRKSIMTAWLTLMNLLPCGRTTKGKARWLNSGHWGLLICLSPPGTRSFRGSRVTLIKPVLFAGSCPYLSNNTDRWLWPDLCRVQVPNKNKINNLDKPQRWLHEYSAFKRV
jgi:hypothetical protein